MGRTLRFAVVFALAAAGGCGDGKSGSITMERVPPGYDNPGTWPNYPDPAPTLPDKTAEGFLSDIYGWAAAPTTPVDPFKEMVRLRVLKVLVLPDGSALSNQARYGHVKTAWNKAKLSTPDWVQCLVELDQCN